MIQNQSPYLSEYHAPVLCPHDQFAGDGVSVVAVAVHGLQQLELDLAEGVVRQLLDQHRVSGATLTLRVPHVQRGVLREKLSHRGVMRG